jgi:hypothetical protein
MKGLVGEPQRATPCRAFALARMRVRAGAPRAARAAFVIGGKGDIASRPIGFAHEADR